MGSKGLLKAPGTTSHFKNSNTKTQNAQKNDLKESLKLLESGDVHQLDIEKISEELLLKPHLGDHIQYELYKYCQKGPQKTDLTVVTKLSSLCYSHFSVSQFTNIDRFVGCVYYISSYLLKRESYTGALDVINSLEVKKNEIIEASRVKSDIRNFLCNIHSSFIASAISLASKVRCKYDEVYNSCIELAKESVKCLKLLKTGQLEIGRKVLKTSKIFLQTIKYYKEEEIYQFCKELTEVLKNLLPVFSSVDYLYFYLHKMDQLKNVDYTKGGEVYEMLKRTIDLVSFLMNFSSNVQFSLNNLLDNFFKIEEKVCLKENLFEDLQTKDPNTKLYFLLVSIIFSHGIQFWWNSVSDWPKNISVSSIEKLSKKIIKMHKSNYSSSSLYCTAKTHSEICFSSLLSGNLQKIQYTIRLCFKNKVPNALSLVPVCRDAFRLSMDYFEYTKSKKCCKEQRIYSWKHSVIHHTNTLEDILRLPASDETWCYLRVCSKEILKEVLNSNMEPPYDMKRAIIVFRRWYHASLKLGSFSDALFICVLFYICFPEEETEIMSMWLQAKSESSNEIFEEMTVNDVLKTYGSGLKEFSKKCGPTINTKPLLLMELKAYSTCSPETFQNPKNCYTLANRIWKQLEKFNPDICETSFALACLIATNVSTDSGKLPKNLQDRCRDLIKELMNMKKKGRLQCRSLLHAANLQFSFFLHNVKLAESSEGNMDSCELVLRYLKKAEEEKVKYGGDVDMNLTCNVIPSSSHLTVELETNYLNELNEIVDLWKEALANGLEDLPTATEFDSWIRNVQQVAQMYELMGEYQRSFTTWLLSYKIGKMCDDSGAVLSGLSHLILSCSNADEFGLVKEGEVISEKLNSENREKFSLVEYSLALASKCLRSRKFEKCLEHLGTAKKLVEGLRSSIKCYALGGRLWCLVSQFLCVHPESDVAFGYPSGVDIRVTAFKAFSYVSAGGRSDLIKSATQSECTELVLAMIEVNTWAYHLHGVYRQTDFMRFFLDDLYQIVQRLFLPTRTAEMLVRLAEVDLICEKMSDCEGKVTKLKSILTTLSSRCRKNVECEKSPTPCLSVPRGGDNEVLSPRPISPARFLDKPIGSMENDLSPAQCYLSDVKTSKSTEHVKQCKCRLCQNLLVQILTMETLRMEAEMHNWEKCTKKAATSYKLAYEAMNKLTRARAEQSEALRLEMAAHFDSDPGGLDFRLSLVQFHSARFLMRYAFFETSSLKAVTENVTKTMVKVSRLMKRFSFEEKLLIWTFMELKLYCVVVSKNSSGNPSKTRADECLSPQVFLL